MGIAAGLTAGVVANLLASGSLSEDLAPGAAVDFMIQRASWVRTSSVRGIWNGQDGSNAKHESQLLQSGMAGNTSHLFPEPGFLNETLTA